MPSGIRVAKDGRSATRGQGRDMAFTSEAPSLKISEQFKDIIRSFSVSSAATATVNIKHNLGYAPVFRLFVEAVEGSGKWYGDANPADDLDPSNVVTYMVVDINESDIQLIFVIQAARTVRYKYWIFEDSLGQF